MSVGAEGVIALLVITDLLLLGSSRLRSCITIAALQGAVVSLLPVLLHGDEGWVRAWSLTVGSMLLKGGVFPWLLRRVLRESGVRREV